MKIVCHSCDAKYRLPDARVAGRKFSIRCQRCKTPIVVDGTQITASEGTESANPSIAPSQPEAANGVHGSYSNTPADVAAPSEASGWFALIGDEQQGPWPTHQLVEALANGAVAWETYVWREGFADWVEARQNPELLEAARDANVTTVAPAEQRYNGRNTLSSASLPAHGLTADPSAAEPATADAIRQADATLTGTRNENSVLFRIQDLQPQGNAGPIASAQAAVRAPVASRPVAQPKASPSRPSWATPADTGAGMANGEGSGLIDIRALASLASTRPQQSTGPQHFGAGQGALRQELAEPTALPQGSFDLQMSGARGLAMLDSLAPVSTTPQRSSAAMPLAVLGGFTVLAAAVFGAIVWTHERDVTELRSAATSAGRPEAALANAPPALPVKSDAAETASAASTTGQATGEAKAPAEAKADSATKPETAPPKTEPRSAPAQVARSTPRRATPPARSTRPAPEKSPSDKAEAKATATAKAPAAAEAKAASGSSSYLADDSHATDPTPASKSNDVMAAVMDSPSKSKASSSSSSSLDDLLNQAAGGSGVTAASSGAAAPKTAEAPAPSPSNNLPAQPTREQTLAALQRVEPAVRACSSDGGTAIADIRVSGDTGKVSDVKVSGVQAPVDTCVARAVRNAEFPRFSNPSFSVKFPFRL